MTLQQFDLLDNHLGYGSTNPRFIIMGLEEGIAKASNSFSDDINENITESNYQHRWETLINHHQPLLDLADYHLAHPDEAEQAWFGDNAKIQKTWQWYCKLFLGLEFGTWLGHDLLEYQKTKLARVNECNNAIIEFLPLPRHNHQAWYPFMKVENTEIQNLNSYFTNMITENRYNLINQFISSDNVEFLLIHGSLNRNSIKPQFNQIVQGLNLNFTEEHLLGIRGGNIEIFALEYKTQINNNIRVFFTPFLGNGAMTNQALANLIQIVRG